MPYTSKTGKDRQNNICISWAKWTTRLKYHRKQSNIYWDWKCSKKQRWAPVRCVWFVASNVLEYSVLKINNQNQNAMEKLPDRVTEWLEVPSHLKMDSWFPPTVNKIGNWWIGLEMIFFSGLGYYSPNLL